MRKTYLAKRNALLSSTSLSLGVLAIVVAIVAIALRLAFPGTYLSLTMPVVSTGDALSASVHATLSGFADTHSLTLSNENLSEQNQALSEENRALADKVASLAALLGDSSRTSDGSGIVAGVVARPPVSPYDTLVLGKGSDDGIALSMEAFGNGGVPLGVVSSVTAQFSRVTLFSASGQSLAAWAGASHAPITLAGAGAGAFSASIPRAASIAVGDVVYAPGSGALPIGTVRRIDGDPASPSVTLRIAPAANPFSLSYVVLRDSGAELLGALSCATTSAP